MNDNLVDYLAAIDQRLLFYLDEDDEMMFDTVERLRSYTTALLEGSITPAALFNKWTDWFALVPAFVFAYGSEDLAKMQDAAVFLQEHDRCGSHRGRPGLLAGAGVAASRVPRDTGDHRKVVAGLLHGRDEVGDQLP